MRLPTDYWLRTILQYIYSQREERLAVHSWQINASVGKLKFARTIVGRAGGIGIGRAIGIGEGAARWHGGWDESACELDDHDGIDGDVDVVLEVAAHRILDIGFKG